MATLTPHQIDNALRFTAHLGNLHIGKAKITPASPVGEPEVKKSIWMSVRNAFWLGHDTVRAESPESDKDIWVYTLGMLAALEERTKFLKGEGGDPSLFRQFLTLSNSRVIKHQQAAAGMPEADVNRIAEGLVEESLTKPLETIWGDD